MNWKFWKKKQANPVLKMAKPKDLSSRVGKYLVVDLKNDPDWVWALKEVTTKRENQKDVIDFRIFDPAKTRAEGIEIKNYNSLDDYPNMIWFDGWYNKNNREITMNSYYESQKMK